MSIDIFNAEITDEEILRSVKALRKVRVDNMITELFIYSPDCILPILNKLFHSIYDKGTFPEPRSKSVIGSIDEKGDTTCTSNYRDISLLNVVVKLYAGILFKRLSFSKCFDKINEKQAGVSKNHSTAFILLSMANKQLRRKGSEK